MPIPTISRRRLGIKAWRPKQDCFSGASRFNLVALIYWIGLNQKHWSRHLGQKLDQGRANRVNAFGGTSPAKNLRGLSSKIKSMSVWLTPRASSIGINSVNM